MTRTLILVPGILSDAAMWRNQIRGLSDLADCRVETAHGKSIEAAADDVLARAPARFALAGHSLGGYVALAMLRKAPERISRLCLVSTSAQPDSEAQRASRIALMESAKADFDGVCAKLLRAMLHPDRLADDALCARLRAMMRRVGLDAFLHQQQAAMTRPDSRPQLAAIACPTLIVTGDTDRIVPPAHSAELAAAIAGAWLTTIARCGHATPMEAADQVTQAMRAWLQPQD